MPANADDVLRVVPGGGCTTFGECRTGVHRADGKYKFLGGVLGCDGKIYFIPSDSDRVLQVNPETLTCREVGPSLKNEVRVLRVAKSPLMSPLMLLALFFPRSSVADIRHE